jgi:hypothetical protein
MYNEQAYMPLYSATVINSHNGFYLVCDEQIGVHQSYRINKVSSVLDPN